MTALVAHRGSAARIVHLLFLIIGPLLLAACAGGTSVNPAGSSVASWQTGRVIELKTGRSLDLPTFLSTLSRYEIVDRKSTRLNSSH